MPDRAKILFFDIENMANVGFTWGKYEQTVIEFLEPWYMLSFSWKWLGDKKVQTKTLTDFQSFEKNPKDDRELTQALWNLLDEADIVIAHNGDNHDLKKARTRFAYHKMAPPSPLQSIDTLKIARRCFKFESNKLDDLGAFLGVGRKLPNEGFRLWRRCYFGERQAFEDMRKYNREDTALLERVYYALRSWYPQHPLLTNYTKDEACPICQSRKIEYRGYAVTKTGKRRRMHCLDTTCGAWSTDKELIREVA